jgi:hypothetical protein
MPETILKKINIAIAILLLLFLKQSSVHAQTTTVRGAITDAKTGEGIPFVNVFFEGTNDGKTTDFNGQYFIETNDVVSKLRFSILGYKTEIRDIKYGESQILSLKLSPEVKQLKEVTIKGEKKRYRNKNNPAVDLIRLVIDHKKENRKDNISSFQYEKYEKVQFALSNISEKFKNKKYLKHFQFIFDNLDSNQMPGKVILPIYLKEQLSDYYYRKDPKGVKEIIKGVKKVDFDDFLNNEGVETFISYLYQDINIYNNTVPILTNQFISPISDNGPLYYRYYIKDTTMLGDQKCYHMTFYPRSKADFTFQGELYITFDEKYAVCKSELTVSPDINLNFVKELVLTQDYKEVVPGEWLVNKDNISIDFGLSKSGLGVYGQRSVSYKDFVLDEPKPDDFYKGENPVTLDSVENLPESFWEEKRHSELTNSEKGTYSMVDSIQHIPAFKRAANIMVLIFAGYEDAGLFEIGPVSTFYSYNPIEGSRIRFGGRTSLKFSPRIRYEAYGVYGTLDQQWKYFFGITKAIGKKSVQDFPQKNFRISYQDETKIPGQELQFVQEDNILLSFKRGPNDKLLYNHMFNIGLLCEYQSHFSFDIGFQYLRQAPAGTLHFNTVNYNDATYNIPYIETSPVTLTLRYAPHEQFYQGKNYRIPMFNSYPIFELRTTASRKGFLNSDYSYQSVALRIFKQINVAPFGYTNVSVEGGKVYGHVPYPLLMIHRANQTFSYQLYSYNLMNFLEFISDEYVAIDIHHYFNGFFFNKIPVLKILKWREVATLKMLFGNITDNNNPSLHEDLFLLPQDQYGNPTSFSLSGKPYMEASVGIANMFKIVRVDFIKRLNYLQNPHVSSFGIRVRAKFDF